MAKPLRRRFFLRHARLLGRAWAFALVLNDI